MSGGLWKGRLIVVLAAACVIVKAFSAHDDHPNRPFNPTYTLIVNLSLFALATWVGFSNATRPQPSSPTWKIERYRQLGEFAALFTIYLLARTAESAWIYGGRGVGISILALAGFPVGLFYAGKLRIYRISRFDFGYGNGKKAVVCESDPGARLQLRQRLRDQGFQVTTCSSANEVMGHAESERFDLFVCTETLPAHQDLHDRLKTITGHRDLPASVVRI